MWRAPAGEDTPGHLTAVKPTESASMNDSGGPLKAAASPAPGSSPERHSSLTALCGGLITPPIAWMTAGPTRRFKPQTVGLQRPEFSREKLLLCRADGNMEVIGDVRAAPGSFVRPVSSSLALRWNVSPPEEEEEHQRTRASSQRFSCWLNRSCSSVSQNHRKLESSYRIRIQFDPINGFYYEGNVRQAI